MTVKTAVSGFFSPYTVRRVVRLLFVLACFGFLPGCASHAPDEGTTSASAMATMDIAQREPITHLAFAQVEDEGQQVLIPKPTETVADSQDPASIETAAGSSDE